MARELLVGGTDRIAVTRLPSINLASQAYRGEAGDGSFLVDDEAAALTFPSLKVVEMTDDASGGTKYLYRGRVMSKALDGDPYVTGNSRMYAISTSDSNWDLRRLRVHNWVTAIGDRAGAGGGPRRLHPQRLLEHGDQRPQSGQHGHQRHDLRPEHQHRHHAGPHLRLDRSVRGHRRLRPRRG